MTENAGFVERALFEAPPGCLLDSTADGERVIVVDQLGLGRGGFVGRDGVYVSDLDSPDRPQRVFWDGQPGPELDAVVPLPPDGALLRFSPDRRHVAYLAATQGRTRARVGVDGSLGPELKGRTGSTSRTPVRSAASAPGRSWTAPSAPRTRSSPSRRSATSGRRSSGGGTATSIA